MSVLRRVEPVSGEGRRGSAGEKVVAALGEQSLCGTILGEPRAEGLGQERGCKREKELAREGRMQEGYQESPAKDLSFSRER